ncbi:MAG TPA: 4-carboxy-4-hydroxy-2-oxoadipate aldolase/oxaloacetate decarboxylase [Thermomicrobiales bacterium]|jgi:4-hydroxy-4-methyl-2-oxoglutarate aldolase|nr:4-carboxy-4-hydroxy-2-oxoadipate aldolase/oxaloacetate decarboxylase [Thermomicrobiales bacterium]
MATNDKVLNPNGTGIAPHQLESASALATATIYEAAGQQGAMDSGIHAIIPGMRVVGRALTVRSQPGDNLTLHAAVALAQPGDVIVADVADFREAGHWGEILTAAAQAKGVVGLVINGGVRDVEAAGRRSFPVFARAVSMKATVKAATGKINVPIVCGGVTVYPGDLVVGDDDGVVVVRPERTEETLRAAVERDNREADVMRRLTNGELTLDILGFRAVLEQQGIRLEGSGDGK